MKGQIKSDIKVGDITNAETAQKFIEQFGLSFEDFNGEYKSKSNDKVYPAQIDFEDGDGRPRAYYLDDKDDYPTKANIESDASYFSCCGDEVGNLEDESLGLCPTCHEHM
jgi:hypothetical protein